MSNIQKTLDSLQPYVIGIRYIEGTPVVDTVFKEGWTLHDDPRIEKTKGSEEMNYYMLHSKLDGIGLDELLNYVDKTIKLNVEREKKHDLLREKVNELKEVFKKNSLDKLKRLKFMFTEEDLVPKLNDFDIDVDVDDSYEEEVIQNNNIQTPSLPQDLKEESSMPVEKEILPTYLDENGNPIEMTEEELEMIEEEERAKKNMEFLKKQKFNKSNKVELPPR